MLGCAEKEKADLVISSYFKDNTDHYFHPNKPEYLDKRNVLLGYFTNKIHAGLWNKLILRDLFINNHISFPQYNYYEDMVVSTMITITSSIIAYCETPSYHYVVHNSSLTFLQDEEKRLHLFEESINNIQST